MRAVLLLCARAALAAPPSGGAQGYAEATHNLGGAYYFGRGRAKNRTLAFEYYLRAAKLGYASSQLNVATMYNKGNG